MKNWCAVTFIHRDGSLGAGFAIPFSSLGAFTLDDEWLNERDYVDFRHWEFRTKEEAEQCLDMVSFGWNQAVDFYENGGYEEQQMRLRDLGLDD